jgi:hypothetical protein
VGSSKLYFQQVPKRLFPRVKWLECEDSHSHQCRSDERVDLDLHFSDAFMTLCVSQRQEI